MKSTARLEYHCRPFSSTRTDRAQSSSQAQLAALRARNTQQSLADGFQRPPVHPGWRAHALTVLDDHSRFNVCLKALPNQRGESVKQALSATVRLYGLHAHGQWSALGRRAWKFQPLVIR